MVTPSYVFDLDILEERIKLIKKYLGDASLCFAMKSNPFLTGPMDSLAERFEVCSPGEYEICNALSISPSRIIVSGVNKTEDSMRRILSLSGGAGVYTIESEKHFEILSSLCEKMGIRIDVMPRLSSGNQFGTDADTLKGIVERIMKDENLTLAGIHYYSGTQKKQEKIAKELEMLDEFGGEIREKYGIDKLILEYGPGLSVQYFECDKKVDEEEELESFSQSLAAVKNYTHKTIEMGRFISTCCGFFYSSVNDIKNTNGNRYAIIDGGIHQLSYYGQIMGMKTPYVSVVGRENEDRSERYMLCGSLCTVNDVITKEVMLPKLNMGDVLCFSRCGAYSVTEGMALFLSREFPQVQFYSKEKGYKVVRPLMNTYTINLEKGEQ